jgi:hypothetical protein
LEKLTGQLIKSWQTTKAVEKTKVTARNADVFLIEGQLRGLALIGSANRRSGDTKSLFGTQSLDNNPTSFGLA